MRIDADTTLKTLLRMRPGAVALLEAEAGPDFWNALERTLDDLCRERLLDTDGILGRLDNLAPPPEGTAWETAPLHDLIDHLTAQHRRYRERDLPGIDAHLRLTSQADYPSEFAFADFRDRFHAFTFDFRLHMDEEEEYLFPMALRLEACARHPELDPETYRGSIRAYIANMLRTPEVEIRAMLAGLHGLASLRGEAVIPALDRLHGLVEDLFMRVAHHADLETGVLVPRAEGLERLLKSRLELRKRP